MYTDIMLLLVKLPDCLITSTYHCVLSMYTGIMLLLVKLQDCQIPVHTFLHSSMYTDIMLLLVHLPDCLITRTYRCVLFHEHRYHAMTGKTARLPNTQYIPLCTLPCTYTDIMLCLVKLPDCPYRCVLFYIHRYHAITGKIKKPTYIFSVLRYN